MEIIFIFVLRRVLEFVMLCLRLSFAQKVEIRSKEGVPRAPAPALDLHCFVALDAVASASLLAAHAFRSPPTQVVPAGSSQQLPQGRNAFLRSRSFAVLSLLPSARIPLDVQTIGLGNARGACKNACMQICRCSRCANRSLLPLRPTFELRQDLLIQSSWGRGVKDQLQSNPI